MRSLAVLGTILLFGQLGAAQVPSQRELDGFILGQHRDVLENAFGDPYNESETDDGWIVQTYLVNEEPLLYISFKFPADDPDFFISIGIAGAKNPSMTPFAGVRLGASPDEVRRIFGAPSSVEPAEDDDVDMWLYRGRNYSFEMDKEAGLRSIQLMGYEGFAPATPPKWSDLRPRLLSTDVATLLATFSPDAEIYKDDELYGIDDRMRKVASDPTSPFRQGLALVASALGNKAAEPIDSNLRASDDGVPKFVFKFDMDSPVEQIVLIDQAGEARVWEVQLR